jgi:hypothetical protein
MLLPSFHDICNEEGREVVIPLIRPT